MLLTIMSHKLRILVCCSPKSFLQPAGAWMYYRFKCERDTICFLHLRLNSIFVPGLRCRQERCAHLCLVSAVHCLHESPFRNPCQTSEGTTVMFHPDPIYQSAQIAASLRELILPQQRCGGAAIRATAQSCCRYRPNSRDEWVDGRIERQKKRGRRWRGMRENLTRIRSGLLMHLNRLN